MTNMLAPFYYMLPENVRYSATFTKEMQELKRIDSLTSEQQESEKNEALRKLIAYSYEHVPYYRELFDGIGLSPSEIKTEKDLEKIPFLAKELLVQNREKLLSDEFDKSSLVYITTSGSTGTPTGLYVQKESVMRERVYCVHMFEDFGMQADSSRLVLRGKQFWAQTAKGKSWQWDAFKRELSVNIFDMSDENMEKYCRAIEKYKPDFAYGYMSAMYVLCKYISQRKGGLKHKFKGFLAISETVVPEQRDFIENVIGAKAFSFYGMSERVIIAPECKCSREYHVEPLYGIAELVDSDGKVINDPGVDGELVGTSLLNYAMPLIRYKMGDMAAWSENESCACGCGKKRLAYVSGRKTKDVLINRDGLAVSMASLEVHSKIYDYMSRYQFVQDEIGKVTVKAVPIPGLEITDEMLGEIAEAFNKRTMNKIEFMAELVDVIPPKANGKFSIIDQHLDVTQFI